MVEYTPEGILVKGTKVPSRAAINPICRFGHFGNGVRRLVGASN